MRILKIILTIISISVLLAFIFAGYVIFSSNGKIALYGYVNLFLGLLTSALSVVFHLKSYRYYRKKKNVDYRRKIPKAIWIGAISFIALLLCFVIGFTVSYALEEVEKAPATIEIIGFLVVLSIIIGLHIVEIIHLEKRIKKGTIAQEQFHEIDEIGNLTS